MNTPITIAMSPGAYLFSISRATEAKDLHAMRHEIVADNDLTTEEKEELFTAINRRFGQLNLAGANVKPRSN